jgi:hypothetical protein
MTVLIELDQGTREEQLTRLEPWLRTTSLLQSTLCRELEQLAERVGEVHTRGWLEGALDTARGDERQVAALYDAFDRRPSKRPTIQSAAASGLAAVRTAAGRIEGLGGGARSVTWRRLRVVLLTNVDAMGAWGVCESLGLGLGIPAAVEVAHPAAVNRARAHAFFQELFLEMAATAIVYHRET